MNLDTLKKYRLVVAHRSDVLLDDPRGGRGMMPGGGHAESRAQEDGDGERLRSASGKQVDPVCGIEVEPTRAAGGRIVEGQILYFSPLCLEAFDKNEAVHLRARRTRSLDIGLGAP